MELKARTNKPLVSVCIPVYNGARYLPEAIDSVLAQSFKDYELIVVDNNSCDETASIVRSYNDEHIYYHKNPKTLTMAENWNKCISLCLGKYICLLHADDRFQVDHLNNMTNIMEKDPEIGLAFSASNIIDSSGKLISQSVPFSNNYIVPGIDEFQKHVLGNYIFCPSVIVRQSAYTKVGGFHGELRHLLDWDMWLRLEVSVERVAYIAQPLVDYRIHEKSATSLSGFTNTPAEYLEWCSVMIANLSSGNLIKKLAKDRFEWIVNRVFLRIFIRYLKLSAKYLIFLKIGDYFIITKHLFTDIFANEMIRPSLRLARTIISYIFDREGYYGYIKKFGYTMIPGEQKQRGRQ